MNKVLIIAAIVLCFCLPNAMAEDKTYLVTIKFNGLSKIDVDYIVKSVMEGKPFPSELVVKEESSDLGIVVDDDTMFTVDPVKTHGGMWTTDGN